MQLDSSALKARVEITEVRACRVLRARLEPRALKVAVELLVRRACRVPKET